MVFSGMGGGESPSMLIEIEGDASGFNHAIGGVIGGLNTARLRTLALGGSMAALGATIAKETVSSAREFNATVRELTKVTDPMRAKEISDAMLELGDRIPLTITQLNNLATQAARFGVRGTENIERFVDTVAKMAVATDVSVNEAGRALAKITTMTRTPISEIENLGSAINLLGQTSATSAGEIVENMQRSSATLTNLGLSASEIVGLAATLNETSESASRAGTRLRRLGQELLSPDRITKIAEALGMAPDELERMRDEAPLETIKMLASTLNSSTDASERLRTAIDSRVAQVLTALGIDLENTTGNLERAGKGMEEGASLAREFGIEADSLDADLQILRNRIFRLSQEVGNNFIPYIRDAIGWVTGMADAFTNLEDQTDGLISTLIAVGSVLITLGGLFKLFGVTAGGPISIAIAGVVGLAMAYNENLYGIRDTTNQIVGEVGNIFQAFFDWLPGYSADSMAETTDSWEDWVINALFGVQLVTQAVIQLWEWTKLAGQSLQATMEFGAQGLSILGDPLGLTTANALEEVENMFETREKWRENVRASGRSFGERLQTLRQMAEQARAQQADLIRSDYDRLLGRTANDQPMSGGESESVRDALESAMEGQSEQTQQRMMERLRSMGGLTGSGAGTLTTEDELQAELLKNQNRMLDDVRENTARTSSGVEGLLDPFERVPRPCRTVGAERGSRYSAAEGIPQDPAQFGLPSGMNRREFKRRIRESNRRAWESSEITRRQQTTGEPVPPRMGPNEGGPYGVNTGPIPINALRSAIEDALNIETEVTMDGKRVAEGWTKAEKRYRRRRLVD